MKRKKGTKGSFRRKEADSNGYRIWNHFSLIGRWAGSLKQVQGAVPLMLLLIMRLPTPQRTMLEEKEISDVSLGMLTAHTLWQRSSSFILKKKKKVYLFFFFQPEENKVGFVNTASLSCGFIFLIVLLLLPSKEMTEAIMLTGLFFCPKSV